LGALVGPVVQVRACIISLFTHCRCIGC
jgi:hypothetical protein